jgi:RimJ/RimL family protein N-acetyltransferase
MNTAIIETERLILRKLTLADEAATYEITGDEITMAAWECAWSRDENLQNLQKQIGFYEQNTFGRFAVVLKSESKLIGICGLQYCVASEDGNTLVPEIGYLFNRAYWHNGYAIEAARAVKDWAFGLEGQSEVFSIIKDTNIAAMNVAIRNGMTIRGRFIKHCERKDMPYYIFSVQKSEVY